MADLNEQALEAALEGALGGNPTPPPEPEEPEVAAAEGEEAPAAEADEAEEAPKEEPAEVEPEFEIEFNGTKEVVKGKAQIVELLQKGKDYSQKTEWASRVRDALEAQAKAHNAAIEFQKSVFSDVSALQALDSQLEAYNRIDWNAAFDSDPFNAMKLKEQRDSLREQRNAKLQEFHGKQQAFAQSQAQATQARVAAELQALQAKLPEWRDSSKAQAEQQAIARSLREAGFSQAELEGLTDHRMLLIARKAWQFDQLQASKPAALKQVRQAPPVVKPGAAQPDKGKAQAKDDLKQIRQAGRKGDHRTQERLAEQLFQRAFK